MAFATETRTNATFAQKFAAFRGFVAETLGNYQTYRATVNELNALSARDLADLGLARTDIHRVAVEAAYNK